MTRTNQVNEQWALAMAQGPGPREWQWVDACGNLLGRRLTEEQARRWERTYGGEARQEVAYTCAHESVLTPDGHGAYCQHCGETLA